MDVDELKDYRSGHPIAVLLPMFRDLLGERAGGTLMWVQGHSGTLRRAARMNFAEGATWSEAEAGTNAPGTALAVGQPVQIFAAEHYNSAVHPWSCSAAPVRDPDSGRVRAAVTGARARQDHAEPARWGRSAAMLDAARPPVTDGTVLCG